MARPTPLHLRIAAASGKSGNLLVDNGVVVGGDKTARAVTSRWLRREIAKKQRVAEKKEKQCRTK